jgi:hypothetical protein
MRPILSLCLFLLVQAAWAHPVIYKGGWVFQGSFMPEMNEMRVGYSVNSRLAVVSNSNYFKNNNDYQDYTLGVNFLAKRWLQQDSQGNIYLGVHGGYFADDNDEGEAYHSMVMADWESRVHYVVFKSKGYFWDDKSEYDYMFRYGFAPFVAGMNTLQTWLILQAYYFEPQSQNVVLTPMIRFFYKNVLWEVGYSTRGQSFLTLMVHY